MNTLLRYFLCGLAMGSADVVPGVSGGTIAFITGIYSRLLEAIKAFDLEFFKLLFRLRWKAAFSRIPWGFLAPLLLGIGTAIFSLARIVTYLLHTWPVVIWAFFFGLIVASIVVLFKELILTRLSTWIALGHGVGFAWAISGAASLDMGHSLPVVFVSGFIAICAMILPGISGAFILVLLGQYAQIIGAVARLDIPILAVFACGCVLGIMSFARVLSYFFSKFPNVVTALLTGFMAGSLRAVWPWKTGTYPALPPQLDGTVALAALVGLAGAALVLGLHCISRRSPRIRPL